MAFTGNLEDRILLAELNARYADHVSAKELEDWTGLWAEDAVWDHPRFGVSTGRDAIGKTCQSAFDVLPVIHFLGVLGNLTVDGDRATGRVWVTETTDSTRIGPSMVNGIYEDDYVRSDDGWLFLARRYSYRFRARLEALPLM